MKILFATLLLSFVNVAVKAESCDDLLTRDQRIRIPRALAHGITVKVLTKTIAGKPRTVVVAGVTPTRDSVSSEILSEDLGEVFDAKGFVARSPSQRVNMLSSVRAYFANFGARLFARVNLARLKMGNLSDFAGSPSQLDAAALRAKLVDKFRWEYVVRSAHGREMIERELTILEKHGQSLKVSLGAHSQTIPAADLYAAIKPSLRGLRGLRNLEIGVPLGKRAGLETTEIALGAASVLFLYPSLLFTLPAVAAIPAITFVGYEATGLVVDIKAERNPLLRRGARYKTFYPWAGIREGELNRAALADVDERLSATGADQYLVLVNPLRSERLVKTFLNNGYREEALDLGSLP